MFLYTSSLSGINLSPSSIPFVSELNITYMIERGEENKAGRVQEHGHITIQADGIKELIDVINKIKKITGPNIIDEVEIDIVYFYTNQCNLEFSKQELELILSVDANLNISCDKNS